jgi:hypothetical protein
MIVTRGLDRRAFLRCSGGLLLALPALERRGGAASSRSLATRFLTFSLMDGIYPDEWYPAGDTQPLAQLKSTLAPLAPHQANTLILKGIDNRCAYAMQGTNGHYEGCDTFLNGTPGIGPGPGKGGWSGYGPGLQFVIADYLKKTGLVTQNGVITVGVDRFPAHFSARCENDVDAFFRRMFQNSVGTDAATAAAVARARARRKSVLDGSAQDYQRIAAVVGGEDRRRIDAHLQALRDVELRLSAPIAACDPTTLKLVKTDAATKWRAFLDMGVLALSCNLTRVMGFGFDQSGAPGLPYAWLGLTREWHPLSHDVVSEAEPGGDDLATSRVNFVRGLQWYASEMAYFVGRLKALTDADGETLFDRTVILRGSDLSWNHSHNDMPALILAGDRTPLRTGRYVNFAPGRPMNPPGAKGDGRGVSHNNLLVTLAHAFGMDIATFGAPEFSTGNLDAELLKAA